MLQYAGLRARPLFDVYPQDERCYESAAPGLGVRAYIEALGSGFEEMTFVPLSDLWERELRDLFDE